jgi:hypothetical protein
VSFTAYFLETAREEIYRARRNCSNAALRMAVSSRMMARVVAGLIREPPG